ncbi:MAG: OmpA family protein [Melioribacter sp.]|nr:OmpA family protein [Melioribacter sp.]
MKKVFLTIIMSSLLSFSILAQLAENSWVVSAGGIYPRFVNVNITATNTNYGGFLSIQRNFTEHVGLRLTGSYLHLEGEWGTPVITSETNALLGSLDVLYYLVPCESVSPYLYVGGGINYRMLTNKATATLDDNAASAQMNAGLGLEWGLTSELKLLTEAAYHLNSNSEFDGAIGIGEINGKDSYMTVKVGILYYFSKGEPSKYCQLYSGLAAERKVQIDYERIEEIVKRYIPREVVKEVVVEKPAETEKTKAEKWILVGVNFEFNSAKITPESYPILYDAAKTLLQNPNLNVEIQGYTDNIGSEAYNKKLSQKRAEAVKNYLISKGVSANRLKAVGYGEANPIGDNNTAEGRAMNRRIEFKIQ